MEVQGEEDAPMAFARPAAGDSALLDGARNPVYHDPPLREKAKEGESFEDLVRQFTEAPSEAKQADPSAFVPADYDTTEAVSLASINRATGSNQAEPAPDPMGVPAADDDLDAFLRRFQSPESEGAVNATAVVDKAETDSAAHAVPLAAAGAFAEEVVADPDSALAANIGERQAKEVVIGFTEKTAETLVKIEEALGSENPVESMKTTEGEISAQLKWTKPVDEMSEADLDNMFSNIEATISRSANRVK
ncbi:MAG: hypothetical protein VB138_13420 [Burkholderia sp.]